MVVDGFGLGNLMKVGSEFLHLCQEQVNLLTDGFGASLAIVALVERPIRDVETREVTFLPVITYPEAFTSVDPQTLKLWLSDIWLAEVNQGAAVRYEDAASVGSPIDQHRGQCAANRDLSLLHGTEDVLSQAPNGRDHQTVISVSGGGLGPRTPFPNQNQIVMPLIYQELMVGLLVTARVDRGWNQLERYDIERVGHTLAAACVLEQRSQWLEQRLHQQSTAYAQLHDHQQDVLDDVLHQFRNPLTALRTFGKLLIKRLQPTDRNRTVAESIVRESDRLQDLLQQLSAAAQGPSIALLGAQENAPIPSTHATALIPSAADPHSPDTGLAEPRTINAPIQAPLELGEKMGGTIRPSQDGQPMAMMDVSEPDPSDTVKALTGQSLQLEPHTPMDILDPLLLSAHAIAQDRSLDLYVTCLEDCGPVWADAKALREVYNNLIDNALKYTPAQGRVDIIVGVESAGTSVEMGEEPPVKKFPVIDGPPMQGVAIVDTGPGIPIADQAHLFERHFRGVQSEGDIPGTGLGLAIAQLLTQQMGGTIQVFSPIDTCPFDNFKAALPNTMSAGTVFIVWLRRVLTQK